MCGQRCDRDWDWHTNPRMSEDGLPATKHIVRNRISTFSPCTVLLLSVIEHADARTHYSCCHHEVQKIVTVCFVILQKALSFLNETANLAHHNVSVNSVFVNKAGEWKLGGLDYVTPADSDTAPALNNLKNYVEPPEYSRGGGGRKGGEKWSTDMWGYGVLIYEVFNGNVPSKDALKQINNVSCP